MLSLSPCSSHRKHWILSAYLRPCKASQVTSSYSERVSRFRRLSSLFAAVTAFSLASSVEAFMVRPASAKREGGRERIA